MAGPDLAASGMDAAQISEAHLAAYADCEAWLLALEQGIAEARAAGLARSALAEAEREPYDLALKAQLEALLEATRAFASSVEEALRALPAGTGEPGGAVAQQDPSLQP